jgi:hypothetical protein
VWCSRWGLADDTARKETPLLWAFSGYSGFLATASVDRARRPENNLLFFYFIFLLNNFLFFYFIFDMKFHPKGLWFSAFFNYISGGAIAPPGK